MMNNTTRNCGCKGIRSCLECEVTFQIPQTNLVKCPENTVAYCPSCQLCYPSTDGNSYKNHPNHTGPGRTIDGIFVKLNFLTDPEHDQLIKGIDSMPWDLSQSGRRKQNFGPKTNFRGKKLRIGNFAGFPQFTQFIQTKFHDVDIMENFQTIEQCSLEYDPVRGASIDPHVDDCWVWGERVVTVNLLSDSILTLTKNRFPDKYNLDLVKTYPNVVSQPIRDQMVDEDQIVLVPMPKNSLIVMYGTARYEYEHRILREDIEKRRVCLAYREFTPIFLEGGSHAEEGSKVIEKAKQFF